MSATVKVVKYELRDALRSRWLIAYFLVLVIATDVLLRFGGDGGKALLSLINVVLFVVPLVSILFGTVYLYNAREFTEVLLAQPVNRRQLCAGLYLGLAVPLSFGFLAGIGLPFVLHGSGASSTARALVALALAGVTLTFIFTALALLIAVRADDRLKGLGAALGLWAVFALLYDGLVLLLVTMFADYSLERPLLVAIVANPIDLARVALLLQFDSSALMGYTGAVFERLLGSAAGASAAAGALAFWVAVPLLLGARAFQRKDF